MKKFFACVCLIAAAMTTSAFADEAVTVYSNGTEVADKGVIVDGRTLVPVRGVFENMGYTAEWDAETKTAVLINTDNDVIITLTDGEDYFDVNGEVITPDTPQQIIDGRFMLPLRAVGEAVGAEVSWDAETKTAEITMPEDETAADDTEENDGFFVMPGISIEIIDPNEIDENNVNDIVVE